MLRREEVLVNVSHFCSNKPLNQWSWHWQHLQERWSSFERVPLEKKHKKKYFFLLLFFSNLKIQGVLIANIKHVVLQIHLRVSYYIDQTDLCLKVM